jgi:endonuclease/exonuclease/phosphatase family metal-dependent hydrolase
MSLLATLDSGSNSTAEGASRANEKPAAAGEIRLLTLNLGLPYLGMGRRWRVALAENCRERLAAAPEMLASTDADVIALQEVYSPVDRGYLAEAMAARYPFCAHTTGFRGALGSGLMLLSRFPIVRSGFVPCHDAPWWLSPLWQQGFLSVEMVLPALGKTRLINVHLAATLPFGALDAPASAQNRSREIDQLLTAAGDAPAAAILLGDFNTGDTIYPDNYRRILLAGYADAFVAVNGANQPGAVTWDAANPANSKGRFRHSPSQRIDHVMVRHSRRSTLIPAAARVVLRERCVKTGTGQRICLSDHYGMLVTLALQAERPDPSIPKP